MGQGSVLFVRGWRKRCEPRDKEVNLMDGWMEYWASERAKELMQEAHRGRLVRALKAARRGERPSLYQRLLGWLANTVLHRLGAQGSRKPSSSCCG